MVRHHLTASPPRTGIRLAVRPALSPTGLRQPSSANEKAPRRYPAAFQPASSLSGSASTPGPPRLSRARALPGPVPGPGGRLLTGAARQWVAPPPQIIAQSAKRQVTGGSVRAGGLNSGAGLRRVLNMVSLPCACCKHDTELPETCLNLFATVNARARATGSLPASRDRHRPFRPDAFLSRGRPGACRPAGVPRGETLRSPPPPRPSSRRSCGSRHPSGCGRAPARSGASRRPASAGRAIR